MLDMPNQGRTPVPWHVKMRRPRLWMLGPCSRTK